MGLDAGAILVKVLPDMSRFGSELSSSVDSSTKTMSQRLSGVGTAMTAGLTLPLVALGAKAFGAFEETAQVAAQTAAAIKSTGGAAGLSATQVGDLATSISNYSGIDDEAIQSAENMLLTFTNVRNEAGRGNDVFNQASGAVADLATRMAKGAAPSAEQLQSASVQLGKALNDPIKGLSSLSRVGVSFTDQQKSAIAAMVESGDTMGAQKIILKELAKEFGGSAKAFGSSAAGGAAKAKVAMGNAMESIGAAIAPVIEKIAGVAKAFSDWFSSIPAPAQKFIAVVGGIVAAIGPLLLVLAKLPGMFKAISAGWKVLSSALSTNPWAAIIAAVVLLVILVVKNWDKIKAAILAAWNWIKKVTGAVWKAILGFLKKFWPILVGVMTGGIGLVVALIIKNWSKIKAFTLKVWHGILDFLKSIPRIIVGIFSSAVRWLVNAGRWILVGLWEGLKALWSTVVGWFREIPGKVKGFFGSAVGWLLSAGRSILVGLWSGLTGMWSTVTGWLSNIPSAVIGFFSNAGSWLIDAGRWVIQGLINGILSMAGKVWDAIKSVVGNVVDWAKGLLGIGSPSKVFAGIGRDTMAGLHQGLSSSWRSEVEPFLRSIEPRITGRFAVSSAAASSARGRPVAISGTLTLTPDGRAFVDGVIARDDRDRARHASTISRMRGRP